MPISPGLLFFVILGHFFSEFASDIAAGLVNDIYWSWLRYDWVKSLYFELKRNTIISYIFFGSPFFILAVLCGIPRRRR